MNQMCEKERPKCEFLKDAKGCALKHITKARELMSQGKYEDADTMLGYAEKHLQEL